MIKIFLRYDDYSSGSPMEIDLGLINVMRRNQIRCTYAVIPSVTTGNCERPGKGRELMLTREKIEVLKQAVRDGAVELALHGWNHRTNKRSLPPNLSEFKGLSLKDQIGIIGRGYHFLEQELGQAPIAFVPPWNKYDTHTLRALEHVGIPVLSANRFGPCNRSGPLKYAPITTEFQNIQHALKYARDTEDTDPIIGVMLHPYSFSESNDSRACFSLDEFDSEIKSLIKHEDVTIVSIGSLNREGPREIDANRYTKNRPSVLENAYPAFIKKTRLNPIYLSPHHASHIKTRKDMAACACYSGIALMALLGSLLVLNTINVPLSSTHLIGRSITGTGVVILLIKSILKGSVGKKSMTLISVFTGIFIALFI
jgi:peptidoglycan/xylan/chitin deacetylase (PgdA/CDA1 family)